MRTNGLTNLITFLTNLKKKHPCCFETYETNIKFIKYQCLWKDYNELRKSYYSVNVIHIPPLADLDLLWEVEIPFKCKCSSNIWITCKVDFRSFALFAISARHP